MNRLAAVELLPLAGMPEVADGDDLAALICEAAARSTIGIEDGDAVVISQKVVSKAEGRVRRLAEVEPGQRARALAAELGKDPRLVELALAESRRIVRAERGILITETNTGLVCANSGIDSSNVPGDDKVTLLPLDPDASARRIRAALGDAVGARPAVVISDSLGRAWRLGQAEVAIGCAGLVVLDDWRGKPDSTGRELAATVVAIADELAAAADLARDKRSQTPAVLVKGVARWRTDDDGPGASALRRPAADDLFR